MAETLLRAPLIEMPSEPIFDTTTIGEGYKLKQRQAVEFKPDFADTFLQFSEFRVGDEKVDRNLQDEHVVRLAREMLGGRFLWEQVNLVTCFCGGIQYRLNGQHTAWARLVAQDEGLDPKTRCPVQWLKYEAATIQDMRKLYASLDRGKGRNNNNVVVSWLAGTDEFPGYSKQLLKLLAQGVGVWQWESKHSRKLHQGDERSAMLLTTQNKLALMVGSLLKEAKPSESRHILRAPVVGAMFATFHKAQKDSIEFWQVVRDGLGVGSKSDPRHTLRNWLMTAGLAKSVAANGDNKIVTQEEMYRGCLGAWNAHRAGRDLKQIRLSMTDPRPDIR
jgi:hypothetical protein